MKLNPGICPECNGTGIIKESMFKFGCLFCMGDGTIAAKFNPLHNNGTLILTPSQKMAWDDALKRKDN